jgi:hypothetical protein
LVIDQGCRSGGDLDHGLEIEADPGLLADRANLDFDTTDGGLDRDRAVTTRDGGRLVSDEPAAPDGHLLADPGRTVASLHDDQEPPFEQDIATERRPLIKRHHVIHRRPVVHDEAP